MSTGKAKKRVKNIPFFYDEVKNLHGIMLTDTAWNKLKEMARKKGTSQARMHRGMGKRHGRF